MSDLPIGTKVHVPSLRYEHTAVVTMNGGQEGADGRHWVGIEVTTPGSKTVWYVHFEAKDLVPIEPPQAL